MASPLQNTLSTWYALFLRETLERLFGVRMGWVWLLFEPALHMFVMSFMWTVLRQREMGGMDVAVWIMTGMLAFFFFRRTGTQAMHAIDCNKAFFAFRQVRPFDTVFMRACVEGYIMSFICIFILGVAAFIGRDVHPDNIVLIITAILGLWSFGLGFGMISSVIMRIVPEATHLLKLLMMPLYFISSVIMPVMSIPQPYRSYLLYNPIVHGIEAVRIGFFPYYNTVEVDLSYLFLWSLSSIVLGMVLYRVYETRLIAL